MIEYDIFIGAPRNAVWEFLTRHDHIQQWWGKGVSLHAKPDGELTEPWTDTEGRQHTTRGTVTAIEAGTRLQLNWIDDGWPGPTRVEFLLSSYNDGTNLYLCHSGWNIFEDSMRQELVEQHRDGWRRLMDNFKNYCLKTR
ncbi:MAG TPA: SRPBCC domain-containing protein [Patescibacteria group bacterium]|nr:SRPBCC domain-containing protein [Patescibacteria group bacterium]